MDLAEAGLTPLILRLSLRDQYVIWASLQNRNYEKQQSKLDIEIVKAGQKPKSYDYPFLID
jgi:hypothetical protein